MKPNYTTTDFLKTAATVAHNFGFTPLETLAADAACTDSETSVSHTATAKDRRKDSMHGILASGATTYCEQNLHGFAAPTFAYSVSSVPRSNDVAVSYQIYNVPKSIGEAVLIQTVRALATELSYPQHCVRINSLGDTDSLTRFHRELTSFLRKRIEYLPPQARELMKEHSHLSLLHLIEKDHELSYKSPNSLEFLSDISRKHFREIIEFLDMSDAPYEIDPRLLGHHECYSDALFSLDLFDEHNNRLHDLEIRGGRYDEFMRQHVRQPAPAVGAVAILHSKPAPARMPKPKRKTPHVYVVQLGFGPKVRTLMLVDELRRSGIPVQQNLASDSLSEQLRDAERRNSPYAIIIGQKEYVEGTAIFRDMKARNQEVIGQDKLIKRLKRHRAVTS